MEIIDYIEFYGFSPYDFLSMLYEDLLDELKSECSRYSKSKRNELYPILEHQLNKNFKIFEIYAVNKILGFPRNFSINRKKTNEKLCYKLEDSSKRLEELMNEYKANRTLRDQLQQQSDILHYTNKKYFALLENKDMIYSLYEKTKKIDNICDKIEVTPYDSSRFMEPLRQELLDYKPFQKEYLANKVANLEKKLTLKGMYPLKRQKTNKK